MEAFYFRMSKRFTETSKWENPWFRKLSPRLKCLWQFFCDRCDQAGVLDVDWDLASFQIGEKVSAKDVTAFAGRVQVLKSGKVWVLSFIDFQYGQLSETCPAHKPVLRTIKKHSSDTLAIPFQYPIDTLSNRVQEEEEEEEEEKEEEKDGIESAERKGQPELIFPSDWSEARKETMRTWSQYKREKGQRYKQTGWQALLKAHSQLSDEELAEWVEGSMARNYAGIFAPSGNTQPQTPRGMKAHNVTTDEDGTTFYSGFGSRPVQQ